MASITEILFRDHRTTLSITKSDDRNSAIPNKSDFNSAANSCDKCQDKSQQKTSSQLKNRALRLKNFRRKKLSSCIFIIAFSLYVMTSNSAKASPTRAKRSVSEVDNFLNLHCNKTEENTLTTPWSDEKLKNRLIALLRACHSALHLTKGLTEEYIKLLWGNITVMEHHVTWERQSVPWLWPNNKPLPHNFRGDFHATHRDDLLRTDWTREKIIENLGKIYQRFQRIGVGIQIIERWNELASQKGTSLLSSEQVNMSKRLFLNATNGIRDVLVEIRGIFCEMGVDPSTDLDFTPLVLDKIIKLDHWLVYREYENLMDYSHKLLKVITEDKRHSRK